MKSEEARELIQDYVDGWKQNSIERIIKPLSEDCVIIESHGPTYIGVGDVKSWVINWIKGGFKVDRWDIISFGVFEDKAVFEWIFEFSSDKEGKRTIEGMTLVGFKNGKIFHLREYRTTKPLYNWGQRRKLDTF